MKEITVRIEREQIEVTSCPAILGLPGPMDVARRFISGLLTVYVTVDGKELPPMTPEQFEERQANNGQLEQPRPEADLK